MMQVPPGASELPATWKFDFPVYHPVDLAAWRAWLAANHASQRGCWVASWRGTRTAERVPYPDLVEEALCWGWIDSTVNTFDDERGLQLMTPRKPKSTWTRLNRRRVADMEAQGRMTDAGRRAVAVAQANGWWTILEPVEDLIEPDDLRAALDADPAARAGWDATPPSKRKQLLFQIVSAAAADTRAKRIAAVTSGVRHQQRESGDR